MIKNVQTKCILFGEAPRIRVKKFKHNLPENYSKSTKIAISLQHVNFQKFSGGACPRTPLELSWFNQLQICSAEKNTLKKMWKLCPPLLKFLATPLPSLVVDEENLVIGFGPPHFRNASAIAAPRAFLKLSIIVIALIQKGLSCPSLGMGAPHRAS